MKKSRFLTGWILTMTLLLAAVMPMSTSVLVQASEKMELNKEEISLYVGKKSKLRVESQEAEEIIWTSSNEKIAKVNKKGKVSAVKAGTAVITATVKGTEKSADCEVTVGKYAKAIKIGSAENVILKEGEATVIKVTVAPAKVLEKTVTYQSSNPEIASVNELGEITAVKQGLTEIVITTKAKDKNGENLVKTVAVYVQPADEETEESNGSTGGTSGGGSGSGSVSSSGPIADKIVSGNTQTFVLDKSYTDQITATITVNGKSWNNAGTVESVLDDLETTWIEKESGDKKLFVDRELEGECWWLVTDLTTGELLFKVKAESTYEGDSAYGQIIVEQVSGNVSVQVR